MYYVVHTTYYYQGTLRTSSSIVCWMACSTAAVSVPPTSINFPIMRARNLRKRLSTIQLSWRILLCSLLKAQRTFPLNSWIHKWLLLKATCSNRQTLITIQILTTRIIVHRQLLLNLRRPTRHKIWFCSGWKCWIWSNTYYLIHNMSPKSRSFWIRSNLLNSSMHVTVRIFSHLLLSTAPSKKCQFVPFIAGTLRN